MFDLNAKNKEKIYNRLATNLPLKNENFDIKKFKDRLISNDFKLIETSLHTKLSALDGISSALDYIEFSKEANYKAFFVTDHNNVQSFPDFHEFKKINKDLKIVYGCEFEMIEKDFPNFIITSKNEKKNKVFKKKIDEIVYCIFDLETTGFFSSQDEIIDIGYVIIKNKEIIKTGDYSIKPNREIISKLIYDLTKIDKDELYKSSSINVVLEQVKKDWEDCGVEVLVSHNLLKFDFPFLNKAWIEVFNEELLYPGIDTLPLSWISFPGKKSYSLEKLSKQGKNKVDQKHRGLDDSLLLKNLFEKIFKIAKDKNFSKWEEFKSLIEDKFYHRGIVTKIKVLAKNKKGLSSLYNLVKISRVDNFHKSLFLFREDIENHRENLLIGASGDIDSEIFSLFSTFCPEKNVKEIFSFYDYIEVCGIDCFSHFLASENFSLDGLKIILLSIIKNAENFGSLILVSNNVHYCKKNQKKIKEIIVSNKGMNGSKHNLYRFATSSFLKDGFESLPEQHLRSLDENISNWEFLQDEKIIEKILFENPDEILNKTEKIEIFERHIGYPSSPSNENEIISFCMKKVNKMFNNNVPNFVSERIQKEWKMLKKNYLAVYWLSWKVVSKAHEKGNIVGSRGSVGCSLIAYLLQITDINPLPLYSICSNCNDCREIERTEEQNNSSCYDFESKKCTVCENGFIKFEGHSLPFETFVGWDGEKTPDIDLNFSGEYQKIAHNHIRDLLGKDHVYRAGTINRLSQQTADNFWFGHQKLRKELNPNFNLRNWSKGLIENDNNSSDDILEKSKEFAIKQLDGIKRTTGQHPGGLLVIPSKVKILDFTPLNYPADDNSSDWLTTHFEYSFLSKIFFKLDMLGHDEPTILQKLFLATGKNPLNENDVSFSDKNIMDIFTNGDTLGIPEFGTDLVKRSLLDPIKPTKFSQLVQISGFSHGTDVWLQNQQQIYKDKKLPLEKLLACREDILSMLDIKGVDKKISFQATEFIRKGKWDKLGKNIVDEIKEKLFGKEGEVYFSILEKIRYIFPKPHAIAYTMTAWRTAYYKVYFPEKFYSTLLTYHATSYDIWLMTFDTNKTITFRLNKIIDTIDTMKASKKEFISISKVLIKLSKDNEDLKKFTEVVFDNEKTYYEIFNVSIDFEKEELDRSFKLIIEMQNKKASLLSSLRLEKVKKEIIFIENAYQVLIDKEKKDIYDRKILLRKRINENFSSRELNEWKMTTKEKDLLFTLKVISEIKTKGFNFSVGVDFNHSEMNNFKFIEGKMLIPFSAITSVGEAVSNKIIDYRNEKGSITDWKEELRKIVNKRSYEQFLDLEENNLLFNIT